MKRICVGLIALAVTGAVNAVDWKHYQNFKDSLEFKYWLTGVTDGFYAVNESLTKDPRKGVFCLPSNVDLDMKNKLSILDDYLLNAPGAMSVINNPLPGINVFQLISLDYLHALSTRFPCK
ncbi:hypothetical protein E5U26_28035 [Burkholderia pseudomallei]|uniref:hypothetical protein n=1 Tax=Burkholderia pseudomallei TaxID=28450 RepID=UPI001560992E|nr:hypothetical protein [Burkholderia pseudomallei]NRE34357.1 hypothetical protein [Burkholderia pseudomallei]